MTNDDVRSFEALLRAACPDYSGIHATHLGNYRLRVESVTAEGLGSTMIVSLDEDLQPAHWARSVAKHLNAPVAA
jgi:hypothetical protein